MLILLKVTKQREFSTYTVILHAKLTDYLLTRMYSMSFQYVGKSETTFSISFNKYWKELSNPKAIQV